VVPRAQHHSSAATYQHQRHAATTSNTTTRGSGQQKFVCCRSSVSKCGEMAGAGAGLRDFLANRPPRCRTQHRAAHPILRHGSFFFSYPSDPRYMLNQRAASTKWPVQKPFNRLWRSCNSLQQGISRSIRYSTRFKTHCAGVTSHIRGMP